MDPRSNVDPRPKPCGPAHSTKLLVYFILTAFKLSVFDCQSFETAGCFRVCLAFDELVEACWPPAAPPFCPASAGEDGPTKAPTITASRKRVILNIPGSILLLKDRRRTARAIILRSTKQHPQVSMAGLDCAPNRIKIGSKHAFDRPKVLHRTLVGFGT